MSTYNGSRFRFRPVGEVVRELEMLSPRILFGDDNVMVHTRYSRELFEAMLPMGKHWVGQASLAALHKIDNVKLMARSGCRALFIGFESVAEDAVRGAGKKQNKPRRYREIVRMLADHGIAVWGSFIFGLDDDDGRAFDRTVDFCIEAKMTMALFALLTPYPGTALYARLEREGRLTRPRWWLDAVSDHDAPFYEPKQMSREALRAGWVRAWERMYSLGSIRRRYDFGLDHSWIQNAAFWPINLLMHELAERKIKGGDLGWRKHRRMAVPFGL